MSEACRLNGEKAIPKTCIATQCRGPDEENETLLLGAELGG